MVKKYQKMLFWQYSIKRVAFTLAEVLITLGIIGVVAAMTIPTLVQKNIEKQRVTALKKVYSALNQAYKMALYEDGTPNNWYTDKTYEQGNQTAAEELGNGIVKYMKMSQKCEKSNGCFAQGVYKKIDGTNAFDLSSSSVVARYITSDGMNLFFYSYGADGKKLLPTSNENYYGAITVDLNGYQGPNTFGMDAFSFAIGSEMVHPSGSRSWDPTLQFSFPASCNRTSCYGYCEGCTGWVIDSGNMDYLHCDDLSWDGKHKCSD